MAILTQQEFAQAVGFLAADLGLQRLRDRFVRMNALVTRRKLTSADQLADQLYLLTGGLRRQIPATIAFQSIWGEHVNEKLGEEGEKALEAVADKINACLGTSDQIVAEKEAEIDAVLREYEQQLAAAVGPGRARIDMLLKAVPSVAAKLRAAPPAAIPAGAAAHDEPPPAG